MRSWKKRLGALFLALALMLAWSGGAIAWVEVGPGPTGGGPQRPGDTDPDDFPIVASGGHVTQSVVEQSTVPELSPQEMLMLFLARFL